MTDGISFQLFMGIPLNAKLRLHLSRSAYWKEFLIMKSISILKIVNFDEREYLGFYLPTSQLDMRDLASYEEALLGALKELHPLWSGDKYAIHFFSQSFIH